MTNRPQLTLFFTRGISLRKWAETGLLDREMAIYQRLLPHLRGIQMVTYGDKRDLDVGQAYPGIKFLTNHWGMPTYLYALRLPRLYPQQFAETDLIKTNQMRGAESAVLTGRRYKKPIIARSGYVWSERDKNNRSVGNWRTVQQALLVERFVYRRANAAVVPTPYLRDYIVETHRLEPSQTHVIPNYVDTERFKPDRMAGQISDPHNRLSLIFVGRFVPQKNLHNLLKALAGLPVRLTLVGDGPLRHELEQLAQETGLSVTFTGKVPSTLIPTLLNQAEVYVSPSEWEGHPKALIEGMACGLAPIVSDRPGNRDSVVQQQSGLICETSVESLRQAVEWMLTNRLAVSHMGEAARSHVIRNFSLDAVVEAELALYDRILEKKK